MDLRLLEPASLWTDVDDEHADPDREPTVHLPAGAVLLDVEVDPADPGVGIRNDSVIGTYNGRRVGWFGPGSRSVFVEHNNSDPTGYATTQIATTLRAAPAVHETLVEMTGRAWVVTVDVSRRYSTSHVEIVAIANAADVSDGEEPVGFYLWWDGPKLACWSIDAMHDVLPRTRLVYDSYFGDRPASGRSIVEEALVFLPLPKIEGQP